MSDLPTEKVLIPSPCVSICLLDEKDICRGCYRSGREIREWLIMPDAERTQVLSLARERSKQGNPFAAD